MGDQLLQPAKIVGIEYHLPEVVLNNFDLERDFESWSAEKIYNKTGISERHIASEYECASDLGIQAIEKLIQQNILDPQKVDLLIFCTQTPDYYLPTTACLIHEKIMLPISCASFDINLGCSGYIYGLATANAFIQSNMAKNVLLVTGDTYSKIIHHNDRSVRTLFGDAGSATYLSAEDGVAELIGDFALYTDGTGSKNFIVPAGGFRMPKSHETSLENKDSDGNVRSSDNLYMNGTEIFLFTLKSVPQAINALLTKNNISIGEIDWFIFHQANKFMIDHIIKKMNIPYEKVHMHLEYCGNTVSSSIPIVLKDAQQKGLFKRGDLIMLIGFGVGYSWGANLIRWMNG
jgi:3-oxoacyl-[acyl-carrier-protein] synthase-3